jgi:hypothetical protein
LTVTPRLVLEDLNVLIGCRGLLESGEEGRALVERAFQIATVDQRIHFRVDHTLGDVSRRYVTHHTLLSWPTRSVQ